MKLYITRHGQTDWNLIGRIQGRTDIPLNETGKKQAAITGQQLRDTHIDTIICSPLLRAKETAEIINLHHQVPIIYEERIIERDFGHLEGSYVKDMDFKSFWDRSKAFFHDKGENADEFFLRVHHFLDELKQREEKAVLLVCHGGVSLPVYSYFYDMDEDRDYVSYMLKNCEVASYDLINQQ